MSDITCYRCGAYCQTNRLHSFMEIFKDVNDERCITSWRSAASEAGKQWHVRRRFATPQHPGARRAIPPHEVWVETPGSRDRRSYMHRPPQRTVIHRAPAPALPLFCRRTRFGRGIEGRPMRPEMRAPSLANARTRGKSHRQRHRTAPSSYQHRLALCFRLTIISCLKGQH